MIEFNEETVLGLSDVYLAPGKVSSGRRQIQGAVEVPILNWAIDLFSGPSQKSETYLASRTTPPDRIAPLREMAMRTIIWIAVLAAFTQIIPIAYAQSDSGTKGGTYSGPAGAPPPGLKVDRLQPSNCGTPDDPKPCGPLPRRALKSYPGR